VRGFEIGELPKNLGSPFNISATAEASEFKFATQLRFAKAHHKITPRGKVGVALSYGSSQKFGVFFNIYAMAESIDFKLGTQSRLPIRLIIKSHK